MALSFDPVDLVLNGSHCFIFVEQTHFISLGLRQEQVRLLQVVDGEFCQCSLLVYHIQIQIAVFHKDQKFQGLVKFFLHVPKSARLGIDSNFNLEFGLFVVVNDGFNHGEMEDSDFQHPEFSRIVCYFNIYDSLFLLTTVHNLATHTVDRSCVLEKGIYVKPTLPKRLLSLLELRHQTRCWLVRHLNQEDLIDSSSRTMCISRTVGVVPQRDITIDFSFC